MRKRRKGLVLELKEKTQIVLSGIAINALWEIIVSGVQHYTQQPSVQALLLDGASLDEQDVRVVSAIIGLALILIAMLFHFAIFAKQAMHKAIRRWATTLIAETYARIQKRRRCALVAKFQHYKERLTGKGCAYMRCRWIGWGSSGDTTVSSRHSLRRDIPR